MSTSFDLLPEFQRTLICDCVMTDDDEATGDILARAINVAENDPGFRFVCESLTDTKGVGAIDRLQYICRSIDGRIAAEEAINS